MSFKCFKNFFRSILYFNFLVKLILIVKFKFDKLEQQIFLKSIINLNKRYVKFYNFKFICYILQDVEEKEKKIKEELDKLKNKGGFEEEVKRLCKRL